MSETLSDSATPVLLRELCGLPPDANVRCQAAWLLEGLDSGFIVGGAADIDRAWLERLAAPAVPPEPQRGRRIDWPALHAWIDTQLAQALDVAALAARVHLSANQFAARCKLELGLAPMALVRRQRLSAALRLRRAGVPVAQVAAQCGYRSPSALTAALKREVPGA